MRHSTKFAAATAALAVLLVGCGYDDTPLPEKPEAEPSSSTAAVECDTDPETLRSYAPSDEVPAGGKVEQIFDRGRLIVGVSADTYLMASENPEEGNRIEGFDIEFAKAIGRAIFGSRFQTGRNLELRVITAADRIDLLKERELDLVIRNFTINSCRWDEIAFSQVYYDATQKVLLGKALAEDYRGPQDLSDIRVCAPIGSTSLDNVTRAAERAGADPLPIITPATNHTGCLVKFQRGEVDAITGDDTVLAGLAAQDPYAVVPPPCDEVATGAPCQDPLNPEPYGIGANQDDVDLVKFVNQVLDDMEGGAWEAAYNRWLARPLQADAEQPNPVLPYLDE